MDAPTGTSGRVMRRLPMSDEGRVIRRIRFGEPIECALWSDLMYLEAGVGGATSTPMTATIDRLSLPSTPLARGAKLVRVQAAPDSVLLSEMNRACAAFADHRALAADRLRLLLLTA